jgi:membrane-associated phospholipid phosphatase
LLYQITNRAHYRVPRELIFDGMDKSMPFWTWTVWIYFTEYVIFVCAYFGLRRRENVTKYFYAYMSILIFSVIIFVIFPVTFPREIFPVLGSSFSDEALTFLRTYMDSPANCLPSLHVSSCYISSLCFWNESRKKSMAYFAWSTLVAISTMTTKQHYFVDVWTAIIVTFISYWIFFHYIRLEGSESAAGASR